MRKLFAIALLAFSSFASAQKMEIVKGDFGFLKGQEEVNLEFDYSNLTLLKDKMSEEKYISERTKELNEKSKGSGDIWAKKWSGSDEQIWNLKFLELVNVVLLKGKKNLTFREGAAEAKYTLIVEVEWIDPGYDVYVSKRPAQVTTRLKFVESSDKSNVVLEITAQNAPGDQWGNNFSNETRIGEGFAKTGKTLAGMIMKKLGK